MHRPRHQVDDMTNIVPLWLFNITICVCILSILLGRGDACGPGRGPNRRRLHRKDVPLVFKQHVPNVSENSIQASSVQEGRISKTDPRFRDLVPNYNRDIIFRDEEGSGADRLMTQRCNEKLNTLAISVMNQWPGVKLRVTEGWDEEGHHAAGSLHYEGRAVDITTSDRDRSKYGMLARLAVEAGFDWVYYESRAHIHCSVKSESSQAAHNGGCFTANSTIITSTGERKRLVDLRVGERILAMNKNGHLVYSRVIMFLDRDPDEKRVFMNIHTRSGKQITATPVHLFLIASRHKLSNVTQSDIRPIFAEHIRIGDRLLVRTNYTENNELILDTVTKIDVKLYTGVFAPLTEEGTVVVDDIVVSCYAVIKSQSLAQFVFAPVRFLVHLKSLWFNTMTYIGLYTNEHVNLVQNSQRGVHWYPKILYKVATYILPSKMFDD